LHSIPARLGLARSLDVAAFLHAIAFGLFIALAFAVGLGAPYAVALAFAGSILLYEHHLVRPGDLGALPAAFQTYNGLFSIVIMCGIVLDGWVG
jgi:4-hydroxybenzoate polyprenyltransferase